MTKWRTLEDLEPIQRLMLKKLDDQIAHPEEIGWILQGFSKEQLELIQEFVESFFVPEPEQEIE